MVVMALRVVRINSATPLLLFNIYRGADKDIIGFTLYDSTDSIMGSDNNPAPDSTADTQSFSACAQN